MENDNFTALWDGLKTAVREARSPKRSIVSRLMDTIYEEVSAAEIIEAERVTADPEALIAARDRMIEAAAELGAASIMLGCTVRAAIKVNAEREQAVSALVSDAHAGMMGLTIRERFPADDEQMDAA